MRSRTGWTTDHSPLTRGVEITGLYRLQHQVAEHRQAVHSIQNTTGAKVVSQHEALADASSLLSSANRRAIYCKSITPLEHPRVTRGDTFQAAFSPSASRSWRSPTERAHRHKRPLTYVTTKPLGFAGRASRTTLNPARDFAIPPVYL